MQGKKINKKKGNVSSIMSWVVNGLQSLRDAVNFAFCSNNIHIHAWLGCFPKTFLQ